MIERIFARSPGLVTYGITPPKLSLAEEKVIELASRQAERVASLPVDGLVVYDIQDESMRTDQPRPFPYAPCIPSIDYALSNLRALRLPKVVYQCVGALGAPKLAANLSRLSAEGHLTVFVGAASRDQVPLLPLRDAYALRKEVAKDLPIGGVLIAERHQEGATEHQRVLGKMAQGCEFFITQAVYSALDSKNVLSDLAYSCEDQGLLPPYVIVTLSPCGSTRTLEFLRWLGVSIPRYLENDLRRARDILQTSIDVCTEIFAELLQFSTSRGIPLGCNVESVSLSKVEIEASVELVHRVRQVLSKSVGG